MFGAGGILPVVMFLLSAFVMPETPRFLIVRKGQRDKALRVLRRLCATDEDAEATLVEIEGTSAAESRQTEGWSALFRPDPGLRLMMIVVVTTAMAQQFSGVECFMYYSPFSRTSWILFRLQIVFNYCYNGLY